MVLPFLLQSEIEYQGWRATHLLNSIPNQVAGLLRLYQGAQIAKYTCPLYERYLFQIMKCIDLKL